MNNYKVGDVVLYFYCGRDITCKIAEIRGNVAVLKGTLGTSTRTEVEAPLSELKPYTPSASIVPGEVTQQEAQSKDQVTFVKRRRNRRLF